MPEQFSVYLDGIRFAAAGLVLLTHLSAAPFTHGIDWGLWRSYGDIAVTVFFVLSGYVIGYVTSSSEKDGRTYAIARISRLYSVAIVALALTAALDFVGRWVWPDFYAEPGVMLRVPSLHAYGVSLLFLNEFQTLGFGGASPGSNGPYWSLSFEAAYYLMAGCILYCRARTWVPVVAVVLLLGGRTIAALAPVWVLGFLLQRAHVRPVPRQQVWWRGVFFASMAGCLAVPLLAAALPWDNFGVYFPWGRGPYNRNLIQDYLAAATFGLHLLAARHVLVTPVVAVRSLRVARWLGGMTFPLYLLHYPLLCFFAAAAPLRADPAIHALWLSTPVLACVIVLTPACERIRGLLRATLTRR